MIRGWLAGGWLVGWRAQLRLLAAFMHVLLSRQTQAACTRHACRDAVFACSPAHDAQGLSVIAGLSQLQQLTLFNLLLDDLVSGDSL